MTKRVEFDPEDVLLLVLDANERLLGRARLNGITRLEKLVFLLANEGGASEITSKFQFRPHNFGPFSSAVYNAKDFLSGVGLVKEEVQAHPSYYAGAAELAIQDMSAEGPRDEATPEPVAHEKTFQLTGLGKTAASNLRKELQQQWPELTNGVDRIVSKFGDVPLNQIIRYVYRRYPETTTKSIHPEAQRVRVGTR